MYGEEARVRGKTLIFVGLGALALASCRTTTPVEQGEIVTIQYDPTNYDQTRTTAAAVKQCRAKGYATAVPHSQQPQMSTSRWGYQNFLCTM